MFLALIVKHELKSLTSDGFPILKTLKEDMGNEWNNSWSIESKSNLKQLIIPIGERILDKRRDRNC
jgi:hypothetical protein